MGNAYTLTQCPHCDKGIELGGESTLTVMVHGDENAREVMHRISKGESMLTIIIDFCGNCGWKFPCGCPNPRAQGLRL